MNLLITKLRYELYVKLTMDETLPKNNQLYLVIADKKIKYKTNFTPEPGYIALEGDISQENGELYHAIQANELAQLSESSEKALLAVLAERGHIADLGNSVMDSQLWYEVFKFFDRITFQRFLLAFCKNLPTQIMAAVIYHLKLRLRKISPVFDNDAAAAEKQLPLSSLSWSLQRMLHYTMTQLDEEAAFTSNTDIIERMQDSGAIFYLLTHRVAVMRCLNFLKYPISFDHLPPDKNVDYYLICLLRIGRDLSPRKLIAAMKIFFILEYFCQGEGSLCYLTTVKKIISAGDVQQFQQYISRLKLMNNVLSQKKIDAIYLLIIRQALIEAGGSKYRLLNVFSNKRSEFLFLSHNNIALYWILAFFIIVLPLLVCLDYIPLLPPASHEWNHERLKTSLIFGLTYSGIALYAAYKENVLDTRDNLSRNLNRRHGALRGKLNIQEFCYYIPIFIFYTPYVILAQEISILRTYWTNGSNLVAMVKILQQNHLWWSQSFIETKMRDVALPACLRQVLTQQLAMSVKNEEKINKNNELQEIFCDDIEKNNNLNQRVKSDAKIATQRQSFIFFDALRSHEGNNENQSIKKCN